MDRVPTAAEALYWAVANRWSLLEAKPEKDALTTLFLLFSPLQGLLHGKPNQKPED